MTNAVLQAQPAKPLANLLDWQALVGDVPPVVRTKRGRLQVTLAGRAYDTEQMSREDRALYLRRKESVLRLLEPGWVLDADWWHEPSTAYPEVDWEHLDAPATDRLVDAIRRADYEQHPRHDSQLYLTLSWVPPRRTRRYLQELLTRRGTQRRARTVLEQQVQQVQEGTERFRRLYAPLMEHLAPVTRDELCTYLHQSVSWDRHPVKCPDLWTGLDAQLTNALWQPGQPPLLDGMRVQPITIKTWQGSLRTYLPEVLSIMPFPLRYLERWIPMSGEAAVKFLRSQEYKWAGSYRGLRQLIKLGSSQRDEAEVEGRDEQTDAIQAGQSLVDFRRAVQRGEKTGGILSYTIVVWAPTDEELHRRVQMIYEAMHQQGLVARIETSNASIEWLASLCGHVHYGIRGWCLDTEHLTALIPHTHVWTGTKHDALLVASTDGVPFYLPRGVGDLRGGILQGPSRTGKSAKMGLLVRQTARFARRRWCLWDNMYALKAVTLLSGGAHYVLGSSTGPRVQLFGDLDTAAEREYATVRLEALLTGEGLAPDADERREAWIAIQRLAGVPRRDRTCTLLRKFLQVPRLKVGLEPFCAGGEYQFCDGNNDSLAWDGRLICFEMSEILKKPRAMNAVNAYLFQKLESHWFTGDPVYLGMDEAKWLAEIECVLGDLEVFIKARAKLNVSVWLAFQEIVDLYTTRIWQAIVATLRNKILLPNPEVFRPAVHKYYEELGVPDQALERLRVAQPYRDYLYCSELGWRLYQCQLSEVERLLCAASRPEELAVLDALARQYPPEELPAVWLTHWGYADYAQYVVRPTRQEAGSEEVACTNPYVLG